MDALGFPPEGEQSAARWMVKAYQLGWHKQGDLQLARGVALPPAALDPGSQGACLDLYGDVGDYAASGLDAQRCTCTATGRISSGRSSRAASW
jgi:hypothetical protein